jgi:hypothetical protein
MSKPKRVAIYVRVSTDAQNTDAQRQELEAWAERAGHTVVTVYEDQGHQRRGLGSEPLHCEPMPRRGLPSPFGSQNDEAGRRIRPQTAAASSSRRGQSIIPTSGHRALTWTDAALTVFPHRQLRPWVASPARL